MAQRRFALINSTPDLSGYLTASDNATITGNWTFSGTLTIPEASVTAHQAALSITESQISDLGSYLPLSGGTITGQVTLTGSDGTTQNLALHGTAPTIYLKDTDASSDDFWIHVNSNNFYILRDTNDDGAWDSPHPLTLEADTGNASVFGRYIVTGDLDGTSYYGLHINGADNGWIRATSVGFLPHASGGGSSALGTAVWPFGNVYCEDLFTDRLQVSGEATNASYFEQSNIAYVPLGTIGSDTLHFYPTVRGGAFHSNSSSQTGYCTIRYPVGLTNDSVMHSFLIQGYRYDGTYGLGSGGGWCIQVSGYAYSSENWTNFNARIVYGSPPFDRVRFGESETGDYKYILLGESTTSWSYPQIVIKDLMAGYNSQYDDIGSGEWNISFSASTPSGWSQDASSGSQYVGGQIRWHGDGNTSANDKNQGGRVSISTSAASGGYDGDIHFKY